MRTAVAAGVHPRPLAAGGGEQVVGGQLPVYGVPPAAGVGSRVGPAHDDSSAPPPAVRAGPSSVHAAASLVAPASAPVPGRVSSAAVLTMAMGGAGPVGRTFAHLLALPTTAASRTAELGQLQTASVGARCDLPAISVAASVVLPPPAAVAAPAAARPPPFESCGLAAGLLGFPTGRHWVRPADVDECERWEFGSRSGGHATAVVRCRAGSRGAPGAANASTPPRASQRTAAWESGRRLLCGLGRCCSAQALLEFGAAHLKARGLSRPAEPNSDATCFTRFWLGLRRGSHGSQGSLSSWWRCQLSNGSQPWAPWSSRIS